MGLMNLMRIGDEASTRLGTHLAVPAEPSMPPVPFVEAVRRLRRSYSTHCIVPSVTPR